MIRKSAVSGRFYPANPDELRNVLDGFFGPIQPRSKAVGLVVPHAGYIYSGHVAGAVYSRVEFGERIIVLCPNHTGFGAPLSIMKSGSWRTPLGEVRIDEELSGALIAADPYLQDDIGAHRF